MKLIAAVLMCAAAALAQSQSSVTTSSGSWYGIPYTNVEAVSVVPTTPTPTYLVCDFKAFEYTPPNYGGISMTCSTIQGGKVQGAAISEQLQANDSVYYYLTYGSGQQAYVQLAPNGAGQVCVKAAPYVGVQPMWCGAL